MKPFAPSEFKDLKSIEYFNFEEDFIEKNIRCIPMIVRFKMDAAGIKLKLAEWSKFSVEERIKLALKACGNKKEAEAYKIYLSDLIIKRTGKDATPLKVEQHPEWANDDIVPAMLDEKIKELGLSISIGQWKTLTDLQRFALLKLCKEAHENKNFPKAMREFSLIQ